MNLNQLRMFYMVVKHGSLVNAAERLCISQPAVSKGINQLQADHGVDLLEKHGKKLIPTDAGNGTYDIAAQIFGLEKKAESLLQRHLNELTALISIHVSETFGSYFLPIVIKKFKSKHPDIRVSIDIVHNNEVMEKTLHFGNDFGVVSHVPDHPDLLLLSTIDDH